MFVSDSSKPPTFAEPTAVTPEHFEDPRQPGRSTPPADQLPGLPAAGGAVRGRAWGPDQVPLQRSNSGTPDPQDDHGYCQIMVRSLIRAQLGLSLVCLAFALAVTASFPILCAVLPGLDHAEVFGLPLVLVALGVCIYPVILIIGAFYNYQASRLEKQFILLVDRVDGSVADD